MTTEASLLERSIFDTLRYFDIFSLPLTATQIWRLLIVVRQSGGPRWEGYGLPSFSSVRTALSTSPWLRERIAARWGHYYLRGHDAVIEEKFQRHVLAQAKWKLTRRIVPFLAGVPFVRMIGVTGSLSLSHTRSASDLDLFFVVRAGRIWTARLLVVLVAQVLGRRRKWVDREAPDKVCLNHYIADDALVMDPAARSLYTAVLYTRLVPLVGLDVWCRWRDANRVWLRQWLMIQTPPFVPSRHVVHLFGVVVWFQRLLEAVLLEPLGAVVERWAERIQRRVISQHTTPGRSGRVAVSAHELAFHPDSKEAMVLHRFFEEHGQQALL